MRNPRGFWDRSAQELAVVHPVGTHAGTRGYITVARNGAKIYLHRWIWEELVGPIPDGHEIDHINGLKNDCRLSNLRCVPKAINLKNRSKQCNNTSGITGVSRACAKGIYYWMAIWKDQETGGQRTKSFSVNKYGEEGAKQAAIAHRAAMLESFVKNHGYTERHGN